MDEKGRVSLPSAFRREAGGDRFVLLQWRAPALTLFPVASWAATQELYEPMLNTTLAAGKIPCCNTYSLDDFAAQKTAGFQGITMKSDLDLLFDRGTNLLSELKEI